MAARRARIDDGRGLTTRRGSPPDAVALGTVSYCMSEPPERVRLVGFTVGTTLAVVVAVFAAYRLRNAFVAAHQVFGWVVACAVVALLLDSLVGLLQRVLPRWISVIVVLLGGLAVLGVVLTGRGSRARQLARRARAGRPDGGPGPRGQVRLGGARRCGRPRPQPARAARPIGARGHRRARPRHPAHLPGHGDPDAVPARLRPPLRRRRDRAGRRPVTAGRVARGRRARGDTRP